MTITTKKYSFWWENSPPDFTFQSQLPTHVDIAIVGAGFAGISTACWLLRYMKNRKGKKHLRIIILDEAPYPAFKASGRMNGSIYLGSNRTAITMQKLLGEKTAKKLYAYSDQNNKLLRAFIERGVDCEAEFNGGFRMASTVKEATDLNQSTDLLRKWGHYPARFDHNQSQHIMIAPRITGSLFIPGEGMIDPFAFTNKLARLLRKNNVWITYGTKVEQVVISKDGPVLHLGNGHTLTADKVVHTTVNTAPWKPIRENIICRRAHVVRTNPLSADLDDMPLPLMPIELRDGLDSLRLHDQAVVMTGGNSKSKEDLELGISNDTGFNQRVLDSLDNTMMFNFPVTNHTELSHTWTYIETETKDGLPMMGEVPNSHGHYVNIAHGRNKFGLAFLGAKNIAEKILRVRMRNPEFNIFAPKRLV